MSLLNERQINILKIIIEEYSKTSKPISSKLIVEKYLKDISGQTVRNEMAFLEKAGFLEKTHTSSGRVPSVAGFKFYEEHIASSSQLTEDIISKLKSVFIHREQGIDTIIDESLNIINEITHLPSISKTDVFTEDQLISKITAVQLNEKNGMIVLFTNSGSINKARFEITNENQFQDVEVCINIFNKYLFKTALKDIETNLINIQEIVRQKVKEYEYVTQEIFMKMFAMAVPKTKQSIVGISSILQHPEFKENKNIYKIIEMIEKGNIWKQIKFDDENYQLCFDNSIPNSQIAIASARININNSEHQISVLGPNRMNYGPIKSILEFIKNELESLFNEKK